MPLTRRPQPVFVCGESFGGTVALTLAHAAPERIAGLILFSTFGWYPSTTRATRRRGAGHVELHRRTRRARACIKRAAWCPSRPSWACAFRRTCFATTSIGRARTSRPIAPKPSCR